MLIRDRIIAKKNADQYPETMNPGTICAASQIKNPLITNENNPIVRIVIGNVKIKIIGLINTLMTASTTARTKAPIRVTSTPGNKYAVIPIAAAEIIQ